MDELFEKLEAPIVTHLWDIARKVEHDGGFKCSQQVDDVKDCLWCIKTMHELRSKASATLR